MGGLTIERQVREQIADFATRKLRYRSAVAFEVQRAEEFDAQSAHAISLPSARIDNKGHDGVAHVDSVVTLQRAACLRNHGLAIDLSAVLALQVLNGELRAIAPYAGVLTRNERIVNRHRRLILRAPERDRRIAADACANRYARFSCGASARRLKYRGPFASQDDFDDNLEAE